MPVALETIVKQLTDSGIIAPGKLENFVPPKASPKDGEALLRELYKQNLLTKFQAQQFAQGRAKALVLGNYTILDRIGAGGMGQVFKAEHRRLERVVAIKMLPPALTKDATAIARFQREVKAAAKLRHPNIVATDDADEANGAHFLVMEYIEGQDLSALVKKNGPFPVAKAVNYILQAARGLEFAHKKGVVHRDIKPANLLLDKEAVVKILDMGLARISGDGNAATQAELTGTGAVMGTVDYMSPEQALNTKHADHRADIYSLGCSLYYLLTGKPTYECDTVTAKLIAHQFQPIPEISKARDDVAGDLEAVFAKMVAKKIDDRYQSMTDVIDALERCQSGLSGKALAAGSPGLSSPTVKASSSSATEESEMTAAFGSRRLQSIPAVEAYIEPAKKPGPTLNRPVFIGLVAAGLLGVLVLAGIIVSLRTQDGTLIVEIDQPDAMVQVLDADGKIKISQKGGVGKITIGVDPGKHRLKVEKDGFAVFGQEFEIESGGNKTITATLEPVKDETVATAAGKPVDLLKLIDPQRDAITGQWTPWGQTLVSPATPTWARVQIPYEPPAEYELEAVIERLDGNTSANLGLVVSQRQAMLTFGAGNSSGLDLTEGPFDRNSMTYKGNVLPQGKLVTLNISVRQRSISVFCDGSGILDWHGDPNDLVLRKESQVPDAKKLFLGIYGSRFRFHKLHLTPLNELLATSRSQPAPIPPGAQADRERKAAEWVLSKGGKVKVAVHGQERFIQALGEIPAEPFQIKVVNLENAKVKDDELENIATLTSVEWVNLLMTPITDAGLAHLANLPALKDLWLLGTKVTDAGLKDVRRMKNLRFLGLNSTQITDAGLSDIAAMTNLTQMDLQRTKVTPAGVAALRKALPNCKIAWNGPPQSRSPQTPTAEPAPGPSDLRRDDWNGLPQCWKITQQEITGSAGSAGGDLPTYLCSKHVYRNFELSCQVRLINGDTGIQVRSEYKDRGTFRLRGPQVDIGPTEGWGSLYGQDWTGASKKVSSDLANRKTDDFNDVLVRCVGKRITVKINGQTTVDEDFPAIADEGMIGLQLYGRNTEVVYRRLSLKVLDNSGQPSPPNQPWNTPAFQAWIKEVQALPAEQQAEAVSKKLVELNPGFDGKVTPITDKGVVTELRFITENVTDISPVRALVGLRTLSCVGRDKSKSNNLSDLSPLQGMKLTRFDCTFNPVASLAPLQGMPLTNLLFSATHVTDLSPLQGMQLTDLGFAGTKVSDLSPLKGMPLTNLNCSITQVSSFAPLEGMNLADLHCTQTQASDLSPLQNSKNLRSLDLRYTKVTPAGVAALQKALPNCKIDWDDPAKAIAGQPNQPWNTPAFQAWIKEVQAMPADKQIEAVSKKLAELNPGFDGKLTGAGGKGSPWIQNGTVTQLTIIPDDIKDLSPLRVWMELKMLECRGNPGKGTLSDLSPLQGMQLTQFTLAYTKVTDLSPLAGMPLTWLNTDAKTTDLAFLRGMPLKVLYWNHLSDLSPLRGMPLEQLYCWNSQVSDLSPLEVCKSLKSLNATKTKVSATGVAALQKALPNCKIEWDGATSASPAGEGAKATAPQPAVGSIDLLKLVDPKVAFNGGEWTKGPTGLVSPERPSNWSLVKVPYEAPQEYDWDLKVERLNDGGLALTLHFASSGNQGTVCFDGYGKRMCALEVIDGQMGPTFQGPVLTPGKVSAIRVSVRKNAITVVCDGKEILSWQGDLAKFSTHGGWKVPDRRNLFVGCQANFVIHEMTLTPIAAAKAASVPGAK